MKVEAIDPKTGKVFIEEAPSLTSTILEAMADFDVSDEKIREVIDQLDVSADAKSALYAVSKVTVKVGRTFVRIGRKIMDVVVKLFNEYPNAGFGMLLGAILGFLVGSIPILGIVLGPLITPLAMAFGLVFGSIHDFRDKVLAARVAEVNQSFSAFSGK